MHPFIFSDGPQSMFRNAGWSSSRRVDLTSVLAIFLEVGIQPHQLAIAFLESYHGLTCCANDRNLFFDVDMALAFHVREDTPWLDQLIGKPLVPLGYGERMICFLAANGEAVWIHDEWLMMERYPSLGQALESAFHFDPHGTTALMPDHLKPPRYR